MWDNTKNQGNIDIAYWWVSIMSSIPLYGKEWYNIDYYIYLTYNFYYIKLISQLFDVLQNICWQGRQPLQTTQTYIM